MAVRFYDEALVNKIQKWIKDPNMVVLKPNEVSRLWQVRADQKNDQPLTLPLIAISRQPSINIDITTKRSLTCDGVSIGKTDTTALKLDVIPIAISYQIDIYTQKYEEGDEYLRNFIFNFVNHPKMKVNLPYNGANIEHVCHVRLTSSVTDNSDVSEKLFPDQFTRWTIQLEIDNAFLFSIPVQEFGKVVGAGLVLTNKLSDGNTEEVDEIIKRDISPDEFREYVPEIDVTYEDD